MNLKELRKENKLTQQELADLLEVTVATIKNYESGRNQVPRSVEGFLEYEFGLKVPEAIRELGQKRLIENFDPEHILTAEPGTSIKSESETALDINALINENNLTKAQLADHIGVTRQTVSHWTKGGTIPTAMERLLQYEFGLRLPPVLEQTKAEPGALIKSQPATALLSHQPNNGIPLVRPEILAGPDNFKLSVIMEGALDFYQITDLKEADFMIRVRGESMATTYNAGDIVACKKMHNIHNLVWNRIYVISTVEFGMLIKRVKRRGDKHYSLISDNPDFDPIDIPIESIRDIAMVIGGVRLEG